MHTADRDRVARRDIDGEKFVVDLITNEKRLV